MPGELWFVIILLALTLPFTIFCAVEGAKAAKREGRQYDERQVLAQKGAYRIGFFVMMGYYGLYAVLDIAWPKLAAFLGPVGILMGLMLAVVVYYLIIIAKGAYFPPKSGKMGQFWLYFALAICWLAQVLLRLDEGFVRKGRLSYICIYAELTLLYAVVAFAPVIKEALDKRREKSHIGDDDE